MILLLLTLLPDHSMNDRLQDVFLWQDALHVLDQSIGLIDFIILQIVNDQVETRLWDDINQGWKDLQSVFAATEDH